MTGHEAPRAVTATWQGGMRFLSRDASGHQVVTDAPSSEGGAVQGFRPTELLLAALAGCTGTDVAEILRKKRQRLTGLQVLVTSVRRPQPPRAYREVHVEYLLQGHRLREEAVKRAIELSATRYCSVAASLRPDCKLTTSYQIGEAAP